MKSKITLISFILFGILLTGCATHAKFKKNMDSWIGHSINSYIDKNGYPVNQFTAPNGNKVYQYSYSSNYTTPTYTQGTSTYNTYGTNTLYGNQNYTTYGGQNIRMSCTWWVEVKDKTIVKIQWKGNSCKSK